MTQIANSSSLTAVKVFSKNEFHLTSEVRVLQTWTLSGRSVCIAGRSYTMKLDGSARDQHRKEAFDTSALVSVLCRGSDSGFRYRKPLSSSN